MLSRHIQRYKYNIYYLGFQDSDTSDSRNPNLLHYIQHMMGFTFINELRLSFSVCFYFTSAWTGLPRYTVKCHIYPVIRQLNVATVKQGFKSLFLPVREYWVGGCCLCHQMFFCSFPATMKSVECEDKIRELKMEMGKKG